MEPSCGQKWSREWPCLLHVRDAARVPAVVWKSSGGLSLADRQVGSSTAYLGRVLSAGSQLSWSQAVPPLVQPGGSSPGGCPSGVCLRSAKAGHEAAVTWHLSSLALDDSRPVEDQGPRLVKGRSLLWTQGPLVLPWALFLVSKSRSIPEGPRSVPPLLAPDSSGCFEANVPETAHRARL